MSWRSRADFMEHRSSYHRRERLSGLPRLTAASDPGILAIRRAKAKVSHGAEQAGNGREVRGHTSYRGRARMSIMFYPNNRPAPGTPGLHADTPPRCPPGQNRRHCSSPPLERILCGAGLSYLATPTISQPAATNCVIVSTIRFPCRMRCRKSAKPAHPQVPQSESIVK